MSHPSVHGDGQPGTGYRRDAFTWAAFAALVGFGFLNAVLGPALPYLRSVERISYVVGALHQVAFAIGGGVAGLVALRARGGVSRARTIRLGLVGAAVAALGVGYGGHPALTVGAALVVSLLGTSALVGLWAALADGHGVRRAVAMTEGEVSVSLGGILAPVLVGGLAATSLTWRFAFVAGAVVVGSTVVALGAVRIPPSAPSSRPPPASPSPSPSSQVRGAASGSLHGLRPRATLVVVFAIVALEFGLSFWLASYLDESVGVGRRLAVTMVSGLYAANLAGRLVASRLARRVSAELLLAASIGVSLCGLPLLLLAKDAGTAAVGIALAGAGIGATFPLASSMHVTASWRTADNALGQIFAIAAAGQIFGPLAIAGIAQSAGLRIGLVGLPALALLAAGAVARHHTTAGDSARMAP